MSFLDVGCIFRLFEAKLQAVDNMLLAHFESGIMIILWQIILFTILQPHERGTPRLRPPCGRCTKCCEWLSILHGKLQVV